MRYKLMFDYVELPAWAKEVNTPVLRTFHYVEANSDAEAEQMAKDETAEINAKGDGRCEYSCQMMTDEDYKADFTKPLVDRANALYYSNVIGRDKMSFADFKATLDDPEEYIKPLIYCNSYLAYVEQLNKRLPLDEITASEYLNWLKRLSSNETSDVAYSELARKYPKK